MHDRTFQCGDLSSLHYIKLKGTLGCSLSSRPHVQACMHRQSLLKQIQENPTASQADKGFQCTGLDIGSNLYNIISYNIR